MVLSSSEITTKYYTKVLQSHNILKSFFQRTKGVLPTSDRPSPIPLPSLHVTPFVGPLGAPTHLGPRHFQHHHSATARHLAAEVDVDLGLPSSPPLTGMSSFTATVIRAPRHPLPPNPIGRGSTRASSC